MSSFTVYPAIDLRGGRVVRLKEGDPARLTAYSDDPAQTARRWLDAGAAWLHVVNLDGAFGDEDAANRAALGSILYVAREAGARVQFGGGLRTEQAIAGVLDLGVDRAVIGTLAVEQPQVLARVLAAFGPERIAAGIDARDGQVRVRGWQAGGGVSASELAGQMRSLGLRTVIFTDVSRDGLGTGLNLPATCALAEGSGLDVIASGGVHTTADVIAARDAGLAGVIIGRALYEGTISAADLEKWLRV